MMKSFMLGLPTEEKRYAPLLRSAPSTALRDWSLHTCMYLKEVPEEKLRYLLAYNSAHHWDDVAILEQYLLPGGSIQKAWEGRKTGRCEKSSGGGHVSPLQKELDLCSSCS